ncbi:mitotic spindle checkpoint protein MAD1 [Aristolochia californica]|uniref:mitotic spindle checkpoint protein MAD1 n=1 Tax=Aristolochia californica TaxID=171875 RepID=UPI0035DA901C
MILRTPPRKRKSESLVEMEEPAQDMPLVIYEDPGPVSFHESSDQMMCTYQCRQMVKSEFLDAFDTAGKQVLEYRTKLEELNAQLCTSESEKKEFKDRLCIFEQELAAAKGREQALQEQLMKEVHDSQERYHALLNRYGELELKLKKESEVRKNAETSVASSEEKIMLLEEKMRQLTESSERERKRLSRELSDLKNESELSISRINASLEQMECRAKNAEKEVELLNKQREELAEQLKESSYQIAKMEQKQLILTAPCHEIATSNTQILVKHLQEELRNYEAEVREARKLKSSHANNELLKEKLLEEKSRRERAEEELLKLEEIQLNAKKLEDELLSWKSLLKEMPEVAYREDIPKMFGSLQKEVFDNMMKVGEVSAHLKELEVALESSNFSKQHFETENALIKEQVDKLALEVKRLELMLCSVTEERDQLRKETMAWKTQKGGEVEKGTINVDLVKELESSLATRESIIRELDDNLREQREVGNRQHHEIQLLHEKLNIEARKMKSLEREGDRLRAEISLLESKLGHGDYSSANTKILRMVNTFAVNNEARHMIETLQTQLQKAQEKLRAIEDLKGQTYAGNVIESDLSEVNARLRGEIATLNKREERYKAVFYEKIQVFRKACCSLFGYKIVMVEHQRPNGIPVTRFTLQSAYAQNDDVTLEFEYESGVTNILVNEYTSRPEISQQVEIFIHKMNSIAAFTANLTIETFNRQTLS